jgi:ATP-dependent Lon protease
VGVTGELTLSGRLRKIGGVKEKMHPVQVEALERVIFPRENESDVHALGMTPEEQAQCVGVVGDVPELVQQIVQGGEAGSSKSSAFLILGHVMCSELSATPACGVRVSGV